MNLIKSRQIKYDQTTDLLKEIEKKANLGQLGSSPTEMLANATSLLDRGTNPAEAALMKFITEDPYMNSVKARIKLLQKRHEPVLITGPTGTGKELLAKALRIAGAPFVAENCAAIPENLAESIYFGHKKGAFTGAHEDHSGLLEEAKEGIIFLDEIGDMSLPLQAKFLRAIQEGEIRRVGSTETITLDCRFVAATKYDLEERVNSGHFREDLFARLMTFEVKVTGLQQRPNDIPLITRSMLANADKYNEMPPFNQEHLTKIYKYNVRAIETFVARWRAYGAYE